MPTVITSRLRKIAGLAGLLISVAIVFSSDAAIAGGLTGLADPPVTSAGPYGTFSQTDLAVLEQAVNAESTGTRLAEMGGNARVVPARQSRDTAAPDTDLFPRSGRVLPLLVPRPDAVAQAPRLLRAGTTPAVGVPYPMLRRPTPAERAAR